MKRIWWMTVLLLGLTGCASVGATAPGAGPGQSLPSTAADLPDLGPAPELTSTVWLNADHPLRLAELRGRVVALEMWTFDCINCQHVLPSLRGWYEKYQGQGLVVIGNHFPEFARERDLGKLKAAITRLGVPYPVAQDNDGATWQAYASQAWPTLFLIDKHGHIRYVRIGEGAYAETEAAIRFLLAESYQ